MTAIEKGEMSIRRAAEVFGVPKSSLYDRVSGKVQHGSKPGRIPYLTEEEEEELVNFLIKCSDMGYPHSIKQILSIVSRL